MTGGEQGQGQDLGGLDWRDGVIPVSRQFDDPYFSLNDGLAETRHVFLAGNDLPARLRPGFQVAELGFGTGLNLLALHIANPGIPVRFTSFEAFPLTAEEIARALVHFPEAHAVAGPFLTAWAKGTMRFEIGSITAEIIIGDARQTLPAWQTCADAWFLDGFSPAKNPELWSPELMADVARHTMSGGSFATYTAAGHVRRALSEAGFHVKRCPGHGRKRHMTVGVLTEESPHG